MKLLLVRWSQKVGVESSLIYLGIAVAFRVIVLGRAHTTGLIVPIKAPVLQCAPHENMAVSNDIKGAKAAVNRQSLLCHLELPLRVPKVRFIFGCARTDAAADDPYSMMAWPEQLPCIASWFLFCHF